MLYCAGHARGGRPLRRPHDVARLPDAPACDGTHRVLAAAFVDAQGWFNQHVAAAADRVVLMVAGQPLVVKEAPPPPRSAAVGWSATQRREAETVDAARRVQR